MRIRGFVSGHLTLRSILVIFILVGSATGVNVLFNPPEQKTESGEVEAAGEVISGGRSQFLFWIYEENGFELAYPNWLKIRQVKLEGKNNSVEEGAIHGTVDGTGQYIEGGESYPSEEIFVIWKPSGYFDSIDDAMEYAFQAIEIEGVSLTGATESVVNSNHTILFRRYSCSGQGIDVRYGVVFVWNCIYTDRVFIVHVINPREGFEWGGMKFSYEEFFEHFFECHVKRRQIHPKTEEEKRIEAISELILRLSLIPFFAILCVGFTLTHKMEGFPNMAHVHYASIGSIVSWTLFALFDMNPYDTWPFAALTGGLLAVFLYLVVFQPIAVGARNWNRPVVLTFAFLAISYMIVSIVGIFNYYTRNVLEIYSTRLRINDSIIISIGYLNLNGIQIIGPCTFIVLILSLRYFLKQTKFGLSILATAEDERLASALGIDTHKVHIVSWFISGALSAFAGSIMSMITGVNIYVADELLVRVMAGSVLGGLDNIFGSIIGGAFLALGPEALGDLMFQIFGIAADPWRGLYPIVFLVTIMMIAPNGITRLISDLTESVKSLRKRRK